MTKFIFFTARRAPQGRAQIALAVLR